MRARRGTFRQGRRAPWQRIITLSTSAACCGSHGCWRRGPPQAGQLTEAELREAEDRAARENIALQREAGIQVFTDGEVRRTNWMAGILESTGGMSLIETPAVTWRREDGEDTAGR